MASSRPYGGIAAHERQATRRRQLLDAAFDLLTDGGPGAVTVTRVCQQARLTPRYFYEHFADRDALLDAIVAAEADQIIAVATTAALAAEGTPRERGAAGFEALVDALDADPRVAPISGTQSHDDVALRLRAAVTSRLVVAFTAAAYIVWPQAAHPERLALASSLTVGGVMQLLADHLHEDRLLTREELVRVGTEFVLATGQIVLSK